jgi:pimeloyl-ACP methyl ester carboxylesterase
MAWGERDPIMPAEAMRAVAAHFVKGKLELLPTGHLPWLGEPERTAQAITSFLST